MTITEKKDKLQDELILFENKWIEKLLKWKENNTKVSLPKTYKEIINLQELNITSSNVDYIPHEIGNLINLKKLYVSDNSLNELPFEIRNLHNLTHLWLGNNNLVQLPKEIVNLNPTSTYKIFETPILRAFINSNTTKPNLPAPHLLNYI